MPNPVLGLVGASAGSSIIGAAASSNAAGRASSAQERSTAMAIEAQEKQFSRVMEMLAPFVEGGTGAFNDMLDLVGVTGQGAQQSAIDALRTGPEFTTAMDLGEEAILANASATGGLRGGNTQEALARLGPQVLAQMIGRQYDRLGGLASMGQSAAAGASSAASSFGSSQADLLMQGGAARAGGIMAQANAFNQGLGGVNQALGFGASFVQPPANATLFDAWGF